VYGQVTPDSNLLNPGHSPLLVLGVFGLVLIVMGAVFYWLLGISAFRQKQQPSSFSVTERQPIGTGSPVQFGTGSPVQFGTGSPVQFGTGSQTPYSPPTMQWVGHGSLGYAIVYYCIGAATVACALAGTVAWLQSSKNGLTDILVIWGWGAAAYLAWIMRWAARRVGSITLNMDTVGFSYGSSGDDTPTYISYADTAALTWRRPLGSDQGGLVIVPRTNTTPDGSPITIMDRENEWFINAAQFSGKQWMQIQQNLGAAVMASGGAVSW